MNSSDERQIRHPLATVLRRNENELEIEKNTYQIIEGTINDELIQKISERYDPFLLKYDYLVFDIADGLLRIKGFYAKENANAHMDQQYKQINDYVLEFINPGSIYFVLKRVGQIAKLKVQKRFSNNRKKTTKPEISKPMVKTRAKINTTNKNKPVNAKTHPDNKKRKNNFIVRKREN